MKELYQGLRYAAYVSAAVAVLLLTFFLGIQVSETVKNVPFFLKSAQYYQDLYRKAQDSYLTEKAKTTLVLFSRRTDEISEQNLEGMKELMALFPQVPPAKDWYEYCQLNPDLCKAISMLNKRLLFKELTQGADKHPEAIVESYATEHGLAIEKYQVPDSQAYYLFVENLAHGEGPDGPEPLWCRTIGSYKYITTDEWVGGCFVVYVNGDELKLMKEISDDWVGNSLKVFPEGVDKEGRLLMSRQGWGGGGDYDQAVIALDAGAEGELTPANVKTIAEFKNIDLSDVPSYAAGSLAPLLSHEDGVKDIRLYQAVTFNAVKDEPITLFGRGVVKDSGAAFYQFFYAGKLIWEVELTPDSNWTVGDGPAFDLTTYALSNDPASVDFYYDSKYYTIDLSGSKPRIVEKE